MMVQTNSPHLAMNRTKHTLNDELVKQHMRGDKLHQQWTPDSELDLHYFCRE
jgi:hypothetical protein